MTLADRLTAVQTSLPECRAVLLGDLATGTVLRVAAADGLRQEDHDALLSEGMTLLGPPGARALGRDPVRAASIDADGVRLHLRGAETEVVCAACGPGTQLPALEAALSSLLSDDE